MMIPEIRDFLSRISFRYFFWRGKRQTKYTEIYDERTEDLSLNFSIWFHLEIRLSAFSFGFFDLLRPALFFLSLFLSVRARAHELTRSPTGCANNFRAFNRAGKHAGVLCHNTPRVCTCITFRARQLVSRIEIHTNITPAAAFFRAITRNAEIYTEVSPRRYYELAGKGWEEEGEGEGEADIITSCAR